MLDASTTSYTDTAGVDDVVVVAPGFTGGVTIDTGAGNDVVCGGPGADVIATGDGDDWVRAGFGEDRIDAGAGADSVWGQGRADEILGGTGDDLLDGGANGDVLVGGDGDDTLLGSGGKDVIEGGEGVDTIDGGPAGDQITGGDGSDVVDGGTGHDKVWGGPGDDTLIGGIGRDRIWGDAGNDWISGGIGADALFGGSGNDFLDGGDHRDRLRGDDDDDELHGGPFDDYVLNGGRGDDFVFGEGDHDRLLLGGPGNDVLQGGTGADRLDGGSGQDELWGMACDPGIGGLPHFCRAAPSGDRGAEEWPGDAPVVELGDTGHRVEELQRALVELGHYSGPIDGVFGAGTESAVKSFQRVAGLVADGVAGSGVWEALAAAAGGDVLDASSGYDTCNPRAGGIGCESYRGFRGPPLSASTAEAWRPLVSRIFPEWGLEAEIERALGVIACESAGDPFVTTPSIPAGSNVVGLFQHKDIFWAERASRAGIPGGDPLRPQDNITVAAWLVRRSIDTGSPNGAWGHWSCGGILGYWN